MATLAVISISTPIFLTVILPIAILYYFVQRFYVSCRGFASSDARFHCNFLKGRNLTPAEASGIGFKVAHLLPLRRKHHRCIDHPCLHNAAKVSYFCAILIDEITIFALQIYRRIGG